MLHVVPTVLRHLHYQTGADALVFVADSNHSPGHQGAPEAQCEGAVPCRLCRMRNAVERVQNTLRPLPTREPIKVAIGLAAPAVEAWYLCGHRSGVSEAAWFRGMESGAYPYAKNQLKQDVYGTDRPPIDLETTRAGKECRRLIADLTLLKARFPVGFGTFAGKIRTWSARAR